jgi:hypothetical protein
MCLFVAIPSSIGDFDATLDGYGCALSRLRSSFTAARYRACALQTAATEESHLFFEIFGWKRSLICSISARFRPIPQNYPSPIKSLFRCDQVLYP